MRSRQSAVRLSLLLGLACLSVQAVSADLLQVYREALANDAQYAAARATVEAGREKLPQGLAGLLPVIGATAGTVWTENRYRVDGQPAVATHWKPARDSGRHVGLRLAVDY